jgi:hypothetical protein
MVSAPAKVDFKELLTAFEFASMGAAMGCLAFVSLKSGKTIIKSDDWGASEEIPEDLETSEEYLSLPDKRQLDLGHDLVFSFVEEKLPDEMEVVRDFFRRRGAYPKFKNLLASRGMLQAWYNYEAASTKSALRQWCVDNGLELAG